jgi:3-hydroxybutyryl-CoA dehydrogenase
VTTDDGDIAAEAVVLATGATPRRLPGNSTALTLRTADDARRLRASLQPGTRLVIVGAGWIGAEVATAALARGVDVTVVEADEAGVTRARSAIERSLDRGVRAGKLSSSDQDAARERLAFSTSLEDLEGADAAVEAIVEDEELKRGLFRRLDEILPDAEFLASNTSSVPIMKLGASTAKPERVIGLHFFNPVPVLPLVEIVASIMTSSETIGRARDFAEGTLGKQSIESQDRAGFIVNALLIPYILSAIRMYESGFASKEHIDQGMVLGAAHPMGPLRLADLIGLDTLLAVSASLYEEFRDPAAVAPALLNRMVEARLLGRKSGRGFYEYSR